MSIARSQAVVVPSEAAAWSQLIVDCFGCDHETCCDLDRGYEFLDKIPVRFGLAKQAQPYIFKTCEVAFQGKPGYSGWVPLAEGGAQIHTSANNRFISIDLVVKTELEASRVEEMVREWFRPREIEIRQIRRGSDAAAREAAASARAEAERRPAARAVG